MIVRALSLCVTYELAGNYPGADYPSVAGTSDCESASSVGSSDYFH